KSAFVIDHSEPAVLDYLVFEPFTRPDPTRREFRNDESTRHIRRKRNQPDLAPVGSSGPQRVFADVWMFPSGLLARQDVRLPRCGATVRRAVAGSGVPPPISRQHLFPAAEDSRLGHCG